MSKSSFSRQILKSSSIIGGATVIKVLIGMVRTKVAAILIGPMGMGLLGICNGLEGLLVTISGLGLSSSGIKGIAEKIAENGAEELTKYISVYRLAIVLTGGLGAVITAILCYPISWYSFKDTRYAWMVAVLGIGVGLNIISRGQLGILQASRRIIDLARVGIGTALGSTLVALPCYYFLGNNGIVLSLVLGGLTGFLLSSLFVNRLKLSFIWPSWKEFWQHFYSLFSLGVSFALSGLFSLFANYIVLILINHRYGLESNGLYQAAFGLTGLLVNFMLSAMSTDYYPRLAQESKNFVRMRQIVREQARISLLIIFPGLLAMMIFAPLLIQIFYSEKFQPAALLVRLFTFGALVRSMSWSLGFVLLASGKGLLYMTSEVLPAVVHVIFVYLGLHYIGLPGAALGYFGMYIFYIILASILVYKRTSITLGRGEIYLLLCGIVILLLLLLLGTSQLNRIVVWSLSLATLMASSFACIWMLMKQTNISLAFIKNRLFNK
jgi:antigen flippase